jgi:hypothetical protein
MIRVQAFVDELYELLGVVDIHFVHKKRHLSKKHGVQHDPQRPDIYL